MTVSNSVHPALDHADPSWSTAIDATDFGERRPRNAGRDHHLSVDERSALCLLALARNLLATDHKSVATMIDYAMVEVAQGLDR